MPEEIEIETKELQEKLDELHEERRELAQERAAEVKASAWTRWISLSTALIAVIAAVAALQSGSLVNEALIQKNEALLNQAKASDTWAEYQAKGIKSNGAQQTAAILAATAFTALGAAAKWNGAAARYKSEQAVLKVEAQKLEAQRDEKGREAEHLMRRHHAFAYCVTFTQVAIALWAIAALTRRKDVWAFSLLVGLLGIVYFATGFLQVGTEVR